MSYYMYWRQCACSVVYLMFCDQNGTVILVVKVISKSVLSKTLRVVLWKTLLRRRVKTTEPTRKISHHVSLGVSRVAFSKFGWYFQEKLNLSSRCSYQVNWSLLKFHSKVFYLISRKLQLLPNARSILEPEYSEIPRNPDRLIFRHSGSARVSYHCNHRSIPAQYQLSD